MLTGHPNDEFMAGKLRICFILSGKPIPWHVSPGYLRNWYQYCNLLPGSAPHIRGHRGSDYVMLPFEPERRGGDAQTTH